MAIHYRSILELHDRGKSQRDIAAITGNSRDKIREVIKRAKSHEVRLPIEPDVTDEYLGQLLFPEQKPESKGRQLPDYDYVHKELAKPNVTLSLLYYEYEQQCRQNDAVPYSYRTFCRSYTEFAQQFKATMRIKRKPGELMEVDWAGSTLHLQDRDTGEVVTAYLFLAVLPSSQYSYCEATLSITMPDWLQCHVHAYNYFGGVTEVLVSDNLKVGVTKHKKHQVVLNPMYRDLADHYGTVVMPARVRTPKDKPTVEGSVGTLSTWVIAALRNETFFTLEELNKAVGIKLAEFNRRPYTKKHKQCKNREEGFETEERFALHPLPNTPFEMASWQTAIVQPDYHITVNQMFYSVPFQYISNQVDVRLTDKLVEIYYKDSRLATHARLTGSVGQFSTLPDHMPDGHRLFLTHTVESSRTWAESVGTSTQAVVEYLLKSSRAERQALSATLRLEKLAQKYGNDALERACEDVMRIASAPTVRVIERMLINSIAKPEPKPEADKHEDYGFTRGADYFGRATNGSGND
ncbi:IS21 family transposase [Lacticaseibacillus paracasei]|jgi:transposase|uniref:IS21 family transposase n=1 Tax=Lacticaseibacillus paracasei TaxID=1597 RepID=UPI00272FE8F1|nr:IS21 family transposase [Lacticaseibacillus paracasei]MDP0529346.1 IS21 family transposase [Lacticaseibacillus paracasei]